MARIIVETTILDDHGHYGHTSYICSECGKDCGDYKEKCPFCGVEFNEDSNFKSQGYPFGGSDF